MQLSAYWSSMSIGGFAKVKAATHKLTGEKVTCIEVYNSNNIQCVYVGCH